jgi:SAM-dependent methyltransferase
MSSTSVSILVPLIARSPDLPSTLESIEQYLQTTGFDFDVRVLDARDGEGIGGMIRRGVSDAKGSVVVIIDPELRYPVGVIGDAVALIESGTAEVVFGSRRTNDDPRHFFLRWLLVPMLPDPAVQLRAFSASAARLLISETKQPSGGFDLEIAYLANKYGFRIERLTVRAARAASPTFGALSGIVPAIRIRMTDRNNGYRAPRRCPICFSSEVWSWGQIPGNVVRACSRCKCRYLNRFADDDEAAPPVRRVLRAHAPIAEAPDETMHARTAREKTSYRRLAALRKQVASRARLLEIGVRDGTFGAAAAREYEYVGIDPASATARAARARGLEVYCSTLSSFVNTGPAFDAITLFHALETLADPHDALARMRDLLKPGGVLLLVTFDTEGLLYLLSERWRMVHNFRTRVILYSRSALIELLERSGFEIASISPAVEYRDHRFLLYWVSARWPALAPIARAVLVLLPDPILVSSGSIRIVARRRAGPPISVRAIRSVEATHAR